MTAAIPLNFRLFSPPRFQGVFFFGLRNPSEEGVIFGSETGRSKSFFWLRNLSEQDLPYSFCHFAKRPLESNKELQNRVFCKTKGQFLEDSKFMNTKNPLYTQSYFLFFRPV